MAEADDHAETMELGERARGLVEWLAKMPTTEECAEEVGMSEEEYLNPDTSTGYNNVQNAVESLDSAIQQARKILGL